MNLSDILESNVDLFSSNTLSFLNQITFADNPDKVNFSDFSAVFITCPDFNSDKSSLYKIVEQFSFLNNTSKNIKILFLGVLKKGNTKVDYFVAIEELMKTISWYNIPVIVWGDTSEKTLAFSKQIIKTHHFPVLTQIDNRIDIKVDSNKVSSGNYLSQIYTINHRVKFNIVGNQEHLCEQSSIEWMNQKWFNLHRLGKITNYLEVEPYFRDSDIVHLDLQAIRFADCPGVEYNCSTGLFSESVCQFAWYSGFSQKLKLFLISEYSLEKDVNNVTALLIAQIIWHVCDGVSQKRGAGLDFNNTDNYSVYYIYNEYANCDLKFYKNNKTKAFWLDIPVLKSKKKLVVACSEEDFNNANKGVLPEIWTQEFNRLFKKK